MGRPYREGQILKLWVEGETWPEDLDPTEPKPGLLSLTGENLAGSALTGLLAFLRQRGHLLGYLTLESRYFAKAKGIDLGEIDFGSLCPHLKRVSLRGCQVGASILTPIALEMAHLQECEVSGSEPLLLGAASQGPGSALSELILNQCQLDLAALAFGGASQIKEFDFRLESVDEHAPERFVFSDCKYLEKVSIEWQGQFQLKLEGIMPQLKEVRLDSGPNTECDYDFNALTASQFWFARKIHS